MSARQASTGLTAGERCGHRHNRPHRPLRGLFRFCAGSQPRRENGAQVTVERGPGVTSCMRPLSEKEPSQADHREKRRRRVEDDFDGMQRGLIRHDGIMRAFGSNGQAETKLIAATAKSLETNTSLAHIDGVAETALASRVVRTPLNGSGSLFSFRLAPRSRGVSCFTRKADRRAWRNGRVGAQPESLFIDLF
jgi:hypothetical protein